LLVQKFFLFIYLYIGNCYRERIDIGCDYPVFSIGSDEGLYAWVIANYALGTLGGDPLETTGIIELGGASAQVFIFLSQIYIFLFWCSAVPLKICEYTAVALSL